MPSLTAIATENRQLLAACRFSAVVPAARVRAMTAQADAYRATFAATGVPMALVAALNERESSTDMHTNLANGDPLDRRTVHVPRGLGPFTGPDAWQRAAAVALHIDGLDKYTGQWDWGLALAAAEAYNGFGYRNHGMHSAYVWSGSALYTRGKYASDGHFVPDMVEHNPGVALLLHALAACGSEWQLPGFNSGQIPAPLPAPQEYAGHPVHGVAWVQSALNQLVHAGLALDGSYGAKTRAAVRDFQQLHGLDVDGIAGPDTLEALEGAIAALPKTLRTVALWDAVLGGSDELRKAAKVYAAMHDAEIAQEAGTAPPVRPDAADLPPIANVHNEAEHAPLPRVGMPSMRLRPDAVADSVARRNSVPADGVTDADLADLVEGLYTRDGVGPVTWDARALPGDDVCWAAKSVGGVAVVVFRGSTTFEDWLRDFDAWIPTAELGRQLGPVHPGFSDGMEDAIISLPSALFSSSRILLTGHSLGGARAWLAAAMLQRRSIGPLISCVAFGAPRPGFKPLADALLKTPGRNYRNSGGWGQTDLITALPATFGTDGYVPAKAYTDVTVPPAPKDPWGPFAWHRMEYYRRAMYNTQNPYPAWR